MFKIEQEYGRKKFSELKDGATFEYNGVYYVKRSISDATINNALVLPEVHWRAFRDDTAVRPVDLLIKEV